MKTKVVALISACVLGTFIVQAQSTKATVGGTTFGVRAGINFQNLNGEDMAGRDLDNKLKTGFHVGVNAEIPLADEFYLQPGVLFSTKGAKADDDDDTKFNISYIEIPVNFLYKPVLGTGKLLLGVGPYAAFGVGGKIKSDDGDVDLKFDNEVDPGADVYRTVKRFDFGGNLLVGYEFSNRFSAQLNAQLGLVNINPDVKGVDMGDAKTKNTGFGISVGYRF